MLKYYDYGVSLMIGKIMHWLTNQVNRLLDARKEAFLHRKPGAIQDLEPKSILDEDVTNASGTVLGCNQS